MRRISTTARLRIRKIVVFRQWSQSPQWFLEHLDLALTKLKLFCCHWKPSMQIETVIASRGATMYCLQVPALPENSFTIVWALSVASFPLLVINSVKNVLSSSCCWTIKQTSSINTLSSSSTKLSPTVHCQLVYFLFRPFHSISTFSL